MERYQHIIRFGLFGHSHDESFFLTRSVNTQGDWKSTKPIIFNSILAPTTTYTGNNPSFAVYTIDEETMLVVDIETYYFDIDQANAGNPEWKPLHNILKDYGIKDASPASFQEFLDRVKVDEATALNLLKWNAKLGPSGQRTSCDEGCRRGIYCDYATSYATDRSDCGADHPANIYQNRGFFSMTELLGFSTDNMYETMADPWLEEKQKRY